MPAAAVIPAPIAYIKVVAVKKLVVEPLGSRAGPLNCVALRSARRPAQVGRRVAAPSWKRRPAFGREPPELPLLL